MTIGCLGNCGLAGVDDGLGMAAVVVGGEHAGMAFAAHDHEGGAVSDALGVGVVDGIEMLRRVGDPADAKFVSHAHSVHTNVNTRKGLTETVVLLCERCGRPFETDVIRALCGACQRAQEVAS